MRIAAFGIDTNVQMVLIWNMETIMVKVPDGTKAKLRKINGNMSALLREQINGLFERRLSGSAHQKASHLCGAIEGLSKDVSVSKDYLKKYAPKGAH
jgi:hypothetical protein